MKDKIFLAGHNGMVGSAIYRNLINNPGYEIVTVDRRYLDLSDEKAVKLFFERERPNSVVLAAAKVGGIKANIAEPVSFLYENLKIQNAVIKAAVEVNCKYFIFIGSSCIYPVNAPNPIQESALLTGPLEPTNEGYALAKICGLKLLEAYRKEFGFRSISLMPCNLYGINDSFDLERSHVLSALVRRFTDAVDFGAKTVTLWGSGRARREFLWVDDFASSVALILGRRPTYSVLNVGSGSDISVRDLAERTAEIVNFRGEILWNTQMPDGMLQKCLDVSNITELGFRPKVSLEEGIRLMTNYYRSMRIKN